MITDDEHLRGLFIVGGVARNFPTSFDEGSDETNFREEATRMSQAIESRVGGRRPPLQIGRYSAASLRSFSPSSAVKPQ